MNVDSTLAKPSRLGAAIALSAASAVFVLCLVFEFLVPAPNGTTTDYLGQKNLNFHSLMLYATAGGMHILLCGGSLVFFFEQLRKGESALEFRSVLLSILITFGIIALVVFIACYIDMKVVVQSYQERVKPLYPDGRLSSLLCRHIPLLFSPQKVELLALFPLTLVLFGIAAAVMACFWISHKAIAFAHRAEHLERADILLLKRTLAQLIAIITIVFTTSTIATITLMQVGRDWIEKGAVRDAYIQNGYAMSIFWSACYTSVIILIIILPLWWIARRTRRIQRQAKYAGDHPTLYDQIFEAISYESIAKAGGATLTPLLTSSIAAVLGS